MDVDYFGTCCIGVCTFIKAYVYSLMSYVGGCGFWAAVIYIDVLHIDDIDVLHAYDVGRCYFGLWSHILISYTLIKLLTH